MQLPHKGWVVHRFDPETRWSHPSIREESFDPLQERRVGQIVHDGALYDKFPTFQALMLEIYQMASHSGPWNIFPMAKKDGKKEEAERFARQIYERLMGLKERYAESDSFPSSNNEWTRKAGVSTSFFTNMQGETKSASVPSLMNLKLVLDAAGITLSEFFLDEAQGRVARVPTKQALEQALADAWEDLPRQAAQRPAYLASTVLRILGLPDSQLSIQGDEDDSAQDDPVKASPIRRATNRA